MSEDNLFTLPTLIIAGDDQHYFRGWIFYSYRLIQIYIPSKVT